MIKDLKDSVAIVGIGCRLPGGANDPESFWRILRDGKDVISEVPPDRWNIEKYYDERPGTPGKISAHWGGFVESIAKFDAEFFGISPREAARMDPQQRMLLEVAWESLENAGMPVEQVAGTQTGVFIGISSQDYSLLQQGAGQLDDIDAHTNTGGALSIAANRISYCLDLCGPSIAFDTACSSSLVAINDACRSLNDGTCTVALAGGVNVLILPETYVGFSRLSMLSPDGRCKAFDESANGFVRSEGAGIIVLKPLSRAIEDGNEIYAIIRSTGVNQDGRTSSMTVPSLASQEKLLRETCEKAGVSPADIQYVEAHGTGTQVGDAIEARALGGVLSEGRPDGEYCAIGSVKTNIGHLEPAAGIAGIIKLALSLKHGQIPANLHFDNPNPEIPFEELKLRVQQSTGPWNDENGPPLAGINSFGFGGTNAHAILQQYRPSAPGAVSNTDTNGHPRAKTAARTRLTTLSSRGSDSLRLLAKKYHEYLGPEGDGRDLDFDDVRWTMVNQRSHHSHRVAIVADDMEQFVQTLAEFAEGDNPANVSLGQVKRGQQSKIAFVCSGQGPQWWAMGRELLKSEPLFREMILECDELVRKLGPWSLLEELERDEESSRIEETSIAQPAIFAIQVALARVWQSWGIEPDAVVGHSVGEVAAAYIAGVLSLEEAVKVIYHRGRCMDFASARGKMLAVGLPVDEARSLINGHHDKISLAANNSPSSVTLSGDGQILEDLAEDLMRDNIFCKFLRVQYAFHSPQMDGIRDELVQSLDDIKPAAAELPIYSTVTGNLQSGNEFDAEYWYRNVREPVQFADAIECVAQDGYNVFVELSPHPVLASSVSEIAQRQRVKATVVHSIKREENELATMLKNLGALHVNGISIDWDEVLPEGGSSVPLPTYAWQHEIHWHESEVSRLHRVGKPIHPLLDRIAVSSTTHWMWESRFDRRVHRFLEDHAVKDHVVISATTFIEMAFAGTSKIFGKGSYVLEDVELSRACFMSNDDAINLLASFDLPDSEFSICSRIGGIDQSWNEHVKGRFRMLQDAEIAPHQIDIDQTRQRMTREVVGEDCYRFTNEIGLNYGPMFQGVAKIWSGDAEAIGQIEVPEPIRKTQNDYLMHPAISDACLQVVFAAHPDSNVNATERRLFLPVGFDQIRFYRRISGPIFSYVQLKSWDDQQVTADVSILDENGHVIFEIRGLQCKSIEGMGNDTRDDDLLFQYEWKFKPLEDQRQNDRPSDLLPDPALIQNSAATEAIRLAPEFQAQETAELNVLENQRFISAFITKALAKLGFEFTVGDEFTSDALAESTGVAENHRQLLGSYLQFLAETEILQRNGDRWTVLAEPRGDDPHEMWRDLMSQYPAFYAELLLLRRCGDELADILRGDVDPLAVLFPGGSMVVAEHLYQDSPSIRHYNALVQTAVSEIVDHLPPGRDLRVLEIGAGTGGLTSYVVNQLPADRTQFVFTDVSNHFFNKAQEKFKNYPFIEYKRLDIEQPPQDQEFELHSFDLVLASQVFHATTDLNKTVDHVRSLLTSEGLLVMIEGIRPYPWLDFIFGLTEGWWKFLAEQDSELRASHPIISTAAWTKLLEGAGFTGVCSVPGRASERSDVIIAQGPARETSAETDGQSESIEEKSTPAGRWLIFADRNGNGRQLADALDQNGCSSALVYPAEQFRELKDGSLEIDPRDADDFCRVIEKHVTADVSPCAGIVHMWNLDAPEMDQASNESLHAAMISGCLSVAHLSQALATADASVCPRLWLITNGGQSVDNSDEKTSPVQSAVWGLGRVMINEMPKLRTTMLDLHAAIRDGGQPGHGKSGNGKLTEHGTSSEIRALCNELIAGTNEDSIAIRDHARYVQRLTNSIDQGQTKSRLSSQTSAHGPFRLDVSRHRVLEKLSLRQADRYPPDSDQVEIQVAAAGLNFSDVMKALGLYPGLPAGPVPFGLECAGIVTQVGTDVKHVAVGDEVVALAPFSFGSYATTAAAFVAKKPGHMSMEEAATLPIAYLTAHFALNHKADMCEGERVLIHSATGGVGVAAIELARHAGAEVFATAGTAEKREFLRWLGIEHVMDSRSLAFAEQVREATDGEGVDIILNSLAGEAMRKGLEILNDEGRFLEIGKRDIYMDSHMGLKPFRKNVSFMAIDLDRLLRRRSQLLARLYQEIMAEIDKGSLAPLPHRIFPISNVIGAFRFMSQAKHIGKVVVTTNEREISLAPSIISDVQFGEDATYLITGGLGGFGLTLAQWLFDNGARHLVLMGRSGAASEEAQEAVERLTAAGCEVRVAQADVTDRKDMQKVVSDVKATMPPLKGVIHAAMVLNDRLVNDLNHERMYDVWAPKVNGAWNLHHETIDSDLDFFVLFSSFTSIFGTGGQGNYAASNAFLDSLSFYRHAQGLPSTTISWGFLSQVGVVARHGDIAKRLEAFGAQAINPAEALKLLGRFINSDCPHVGVLRMDWRRYGELAGAAKVASPRFADLVKIATDGQEDVRGHSVTRRVLLEADPVERREMVETLMRGQLSRVLGTKPDKISLEKTLSEIGVDSLMAVELKNGIEGDLSLNLPMVELMGSPTGLQIADLICNELARIEQGTSTKDEESAPEQVQVPETDTISEDVDEMSEEEVDELLLKMESEAGSE